MVDEHSRMADRMVHSAPVASSASHEVIDNQLLTLFMADMVDIFTINDLLDTKTNHKTTMSVDKTTTSMLLSYHPY